MKKVMSASGEERSDWTMRSRHFIKAFALSASVVALILPTVAVADIPPEPRRMISTFEEWKATRPIQIQDVQFPSFGRLDFCLDILGVCVLLGVAALPRLKKEQRIMFILWAVLLPGLVWCVKFALADFEASRTNEKDERGAYLKYLEEERNRMGDGWHSCSRCGTALIYDQGRRCPKCHPRPVAIGL